MIGNLLIWICAGLASLGCTSIARSIIQEPKVSLAHVGLKDIGVDGATVIVGVQVDNPNAFALRVDALKYQLEIGGKPMTSGELPEAATVDGHASQVVEIPVPVKFQDLFASTLDFFTKRTSTYRVKGEARFGLLTIPFDQTGDLKLK